MKLIDMLVEEGLSGWRWPEGYYSVAQDKNDTFGGNIYAYINALSLGDYWSEDNDSGFGLLLFKGYEVAEDAATSLVTRDQYEAALAAKNDGWIEWGGGECPVPGDTEVLIKCKSEGAWDFRRKQRADGVSWTHNDSALDVIAYRLHKTQQAEQPEASEEDLNECIGQDSSTAWSGRWLPSAGCECEYQYKVHGSEWCSFECVAVDGNAAFGWSNNTPIALQLNTHNFRPMRSEADRKRDEAVKTIMLTGWCQSFAEEIYDLVAAGKVPGMKLEG